MRNRLALMLVVLVCAGASIADVGHSTIAQVMPGVRRVDVPECPDLDFSDFDIPPAIVSVDSFNAPTMAILSQLEGTVVVEVRVFADGSVCGVEVSEGVHPLLDREAVKVARRGVYSPAKRAGELVPGRLDVTVGFNWQIATSDSPLFREFPLLAKTPLVRDVAEETEASKIYSRNPKTWVYDGVQVTGDLPVENYQSASRVVSRMLLPGEVIHSVQAVFTRESVIALDSTYKLELQFWTRVDQQAEKHKGNARLIRLVDRDGEFVLYGSDGMWVHILTSRSS